MRRGKLLGQPYHELVSHANCGICPAAQDPGRPLEVWVPSITGSPGAPQTGSSSQKACPNAKSPPKPVPLAFASDLQGEMVLQGQSLCHWMTIFHSSPFHHFVLSPFELISMFLAITRSHHADSSPWLEPHHPSPAGPCTFPKTEKVNCLPLTTLNPPLQTKNLSCSHISGLSSQPQGDVRVYDQI